MSAFDRDSDKGQKVEGAANPIINNTYSLGSNPR